MKQVALDLGVWQIHWYGVLVAAGFIAGLWTAVRRGSRAGLPAAAIQDIGLPLILGAMAGARLMHIATYWRECYAGEPWSALIAPRTGFVFYGGLIGASLSTLVYLRWKKMPLWKSADALAPSIALGSVFGRLGCLMTGCCYGRVCDLPWAVHFPSGHETHGAGVHPTQIYDSLLNLVLYAAAAWLFPRRKFDGQVFAFYLMGYSVLRTVVECFRGDYRPEDRIGFLTPAQLAGLFIGAIGVTLYVILRQCAARRAASKP